MSNPADEPFVVTRILIDPKPLPPLPTTPGTPWEQLLPVVRPLNWALLHEYSSLLIYRPVGADLVELVAVDPPDRIEIANTTTVRDWSGTADDWFAAARRNLEAQVLDAHAFSMGNEVMFSPMIDQPDSYQSSWVLLPASIQRLLDAPGAHRNPGGTPVLMPISRNEVHVASTADPELVESSYRASAQAYAEANIPLTRQPLVTAANGSLIPYLPGGAFGEELPQFDADTRVASANTRYEWLTKQTFVSGEGRRAVVGRPVAGQGFTYADLVEQYAARGGDLVVERVDAVGLVPAQGGPIRVSLATFAGVCPDRVEQSVINGVSVVRFHGWPTAEEWQRLASSRQAN